MVQRRQGYVRDMTAGSVLKHIPVFAIPLLIGNVFQEIYTVVDTMVAGRFLGACFNGPVVWTVCFLFIGILYLAKRGRWLGTAAA